MTPSRQAESSSQAPGSSLSSRGLVSRVALLLFASGFCGLVYQVAWLRLLRLVFGASTAASAAVLAIFMGGIGVGSLWLGPKADRSARPLALYARLEAGIALGAILSPFLVAAVRRLYFVLGGTGVLGLTGGTAVRLVLAAVVLGGPAVLMGGTLPATVRAVTGAADAGRRTAGRLYAANTLGAVLGALVTTFVAIELVGINSTLWVAAMLNLLVAVAAASLARRVDGEAPGDGAEAAGAEAGGGPPGTETGARRAPLPLLLGAAAVTGFAFFLMELVWYRMLAPILGGTSYTFGLILAVALLGIGVGGWMFSLRSRSLRPTLAGFGTTCALEALLLIAPFALGDRVAFLALELQGLGAAGFGGLALGWAAVAALVVLPAALVAGYQFPLLVAVLGAGRRQVGREVGQTYAWNTAGAIVGSLAGGFGLLPLLSAPGTWRVAALLLAVVAVAAAVADRGRAARGLAGTRRAALPAVILAAGLTLTLAAAPGPSAYWRHSGIGAGRSTRSFSGENALLRAIRARRAQLIWEEEGRESSVALVYGEGYSFIVNGKSDGSAVGDAPTQVMAGLVGTMLHPDPKRALVIGLGTGSTAGWLARVPSMERVDVVELEPAVVRVARDCAAVNRDALDNPKVHLTIGDGRELLLTGKSRYDVIFSEPSNPYRAGISSLFTRELYEAARDRLTSDGLFLQWLQGYEVDASVVRTAYATLGEVFPSVESWRTQGGDLLLVASRAPRVHDWRRVARRAAREPYRGALAHVWGVVGAEGFYSGFLAGPGLGRAMARAAGVEINTDDRPVIEYGFARNLGRSGLFSIEDLARLSGSRGEDRPAFGPGGPDSAEWWRVVDAREARGVELGVLPSLPAGTPDALRARTSARQAVLDLRWADAVRDWSSQDAGPTQRADAVGLAQAYAETGDPRALGLVPLLRSWSPGEAAGVEAILAARQGDWPRAAERLGEHFRALRNDPWIESRLTRSCLRLALEIGRGEPEVARALYEALGEPFAVGLLQDRRLLTRVDLARESGDPALCARAFAALEPWVPWEGTILEARVECYRAAGDPKLERARADLAAWESHQPPAIEAGLEATSH